jgi:hypothetical protein
MANEGFGHAVSNVVAMNRLRRMNRQGHRHRKITVNTPLAKTNTLILARGLQALSMQPTRATFDG